MNTLNIYLKLKIIARLDDETFSSFRISSNESLDICNNCLSDKLIARYGNLTEFLYCERSESFFCSKLLKLRTDEMWYHFYDSVIYVYNNKSDENRKNKYPLLSSYYIYLTNDIRFRENNNKLVWTLVYENNLLEIKMVHALNLLEDFNVLISISNCVNHNKPSILRFLLSICLNNVPKFKNQTTFVSKEIREILEEYKCLI